MKTNQDNDILISLINANKPITAYQISKETGISVPQVMYRLPKLMESEIVKFIIEDNKTMYISHSVLQSMSTIESIKLHIMAISDIIDGYEYSSPECVKDLISFIVERTNIE